MAVLEHRGLSLVPQTPQLIPDPLIVISQQSLQPNERGLRMVRKFEHSPSPPQYKLSGLRLWLHPRQREEMWDIKGWVVFHHLQQAKKVSFDSCLGFRDAIAVAEDPEVFQQIFGEKTITCWRAIAEDPSGQHYVLVLFYFEGEVVLHWRRLDCVWSPGIYTIHHGWWEGDEPSSK